MGNLTLRELLHFDWLQLQVGTVVAIVVGTFLVLYIVTALWRNNNRLAALDNRCSTAAADVDTQLKHRHNLIPGFVETVRGYVDQESALLLAVINANAEAMRAGTQSSKFEAEMQLGNSITSLMNSAQQYPELHLVRRTSASCANSSSTSRTRSPPRAVSRTSPPRNTIPGWRELPGEPRCPVAEAQRAHRLFVSARRATRSTSPSPSSSDPALSGAPWAWPQRPVSISISRTTGGARCYCSCCSRSPSSCWRRSCCASRCCCSIRRTRRCSPAWDTSHATCRWSLLLSLLMFAAQMWWFVGGVRQATQVPLHRRPRGAALLPGSRTAGDRRRYPDSLCGRDRVSGPELLRGGGARPAHGRGRDARAA